MTTFPNTDINLLDNLSFEDLETIKTQLDAVRERILRVQNSQCTLFRLPGELRNRIVAFAMHAEMDERRRQHMHRHASLFREPGFFATSRQMRGECLGVWYSDVLVWEEWIDVPQLPTPPSSPPSHLAGEGGGGDVRPGTHAVDPAVQQQGTDTISISFSTNNSATPTTTTTNERQWVYLPLDAIKAICCERSKAGKLTMVTQPAHCDLGRTRAAVESSRSVCPRKGLVRVKGWEYGMPSLRWWVW